MPDRKGRLPLHIAIKHRASLKVVKALLAKYPDGAKKKDGGGKLPLHVALGWRNEEQNVESLKLVSLLLYYHPSAVSLPDPEHRPPLVALAIIWGPSLCAEFCRHCGAAGTSRHDTNAWHEVVKVSSLVVEPVWGPTCICQVDTM